MRRVLVTGASGFLGRAAVAALRGRGYEVHGVARTAPAGAGADAWHAADLLDPAGPAFVARAAGASHLLHLAWTTGHGRFWADPANLAWVRATCALVEAFAAGGGTRVVLAGTCAQYDWTALPSDGVAAERSSPRRPATLYGVAKQAADELVEAWAATVGVSAATGLLFFPYGPGDQPARLVPSVALDVLAGREARVGPGTEVRDFVHVDDCGAAMAALVDSEVAGPVNVGTGHGASVAEVATAVARLAGGEHLLRLGALPGSAERSAVVADVARLRDDVGFEPRYDLERGLRATVDALRALSARGGGSRPATP
jgi:nucleoside-diphosphate-sugar epimerase